MYNPLNNGIIIAIAILQPPFLDSAADPASNFGAIGFVVGHVITHGFDMTGALFDGEGNLENWRSARDYQRFLASNDAVAAQYSAMEVKTDHFIDGDLTVTENLADLGGI